MSQVLLLGGGLAAYAAALDLAEVGVKVWIAGPEVTVPESPVRDPHGEMTGFLNELVAPLTPGAPTTPGAAPLVVAQPRVRLRAKDGAWQPVPVPNVWGIPAVPLSKDSLAILGSGGAFRAYLDRLKPVLTIGKENNFGKLVDSRIGKAARMQLVEPFVVERFGVRAEDTEAALVEPGLNAAVTRAGSLTGGVMQQLETHLGRESLIGPEAGWRSFGEMLLERLALYGATTFPGGVASCVPTDTGWIVVDDTGEQHHMDGIVGDFAAAARVIAQDPADAAETSDDDGASRIREYFDAMKPAGVREYVEIGIVQSYAGSATGSPEDTLFILESELQEAWAVRVTTGPAGDAVLRLSGPTGAEGAAGSPPLTQALAAAGVSARDAAPTKRTGAAPYATAEVRDTQAAACLAWAEMFPTMIVTGPELHGSEVGAAIGAARHEAVRLRRKLTGISE